MPSGRTKRIHLRRRRLLQTKTSLEFNLTARSKHYILKPWNKYILDLLLAYANCLRNNTYKKGSTSLREQPTQILRGCIRLTNLPTRLLLEFPLYKSFHLKKKRYSIVFLGSNPAWPILPNHKTLLWNSSGTSTMIALWTLSGTYRHFHFGRTWPQLEPLQTFWNRSRSIPNLVKSSGNPPQNTPEPLNLAEPHPKAFSCLGINWYFL